MSTIKYLYVYMHKKLAPTMVTQTFAVTLHYTSGLSKCEWVNLNKVRIA